MLDEKAEKNGVYAYESFRKVHREMGFQTLPWQHLEDVERKAWIIAAEALRIKFSTET
jgi:hypothetical protein